METQWTQEELEARYQQITDRFKYTDSKRVNEMLAPEFVRCSAIEQTAVIRFPIKDWEKNQRGEAHGGAIGAMFDTSMGMSIAVFLNDRDIATTDLQISYIRPFMAPAYEFHIEIVHLGRTLSRVNAKALEIQSEKVAATAVATFITKEK